MQSPAWKPRLVTIALSVGFAAVGCVGSDDKDLSPKDKCTQLVSALCGRTTECGKNISYFPNARTEQEFFDDCELDLSRTLCFGAQEVSYSFDECLHALPKARCDVTVLDNGIQPSVTTPSSCESVILGD
jgi:hypothetical protein